MAWVCWTVTRYSTSRMSKVCALGGRKDIVGTSGQCRTSLRCRGRRRSILDLDESSAGFDPGKELGMGESRKRRMLRRAWGELYHDEDVVRNYTFFAFR
jgi:hypothetical protein